MTQIPPPPPPRPTVVVGPVVYRKAPWHRRRWVQLAGVGALALLLGIGIGSAGPGATETGEYRALDEKLGAVERDLEAAESKAEEAALHMVEVEGAIPAREEAVAAKEAELTERESALGSAEKQVLKREKAVGLVEDEIAANTIPGDGVYEVGRDMKPGQYRSTDNAGCYYAVNADANGDNIISNHIGDGLIIATVRAGQFFETQGCSDWVLDRP